MNVNSALSTQGGVDEGTGELDEILDGIADGMIDGRFVGSKDPRIVGISDGTSDG